MQTTSVNKKFNIYFWLHKKNVSSLTSADSIRIPRTSPFSYGARSQIKYDSLSILRIDHEYNSVAHDTQATQMKQDGSQILKQEKWWTQ